MGADERINELERRVDKIATTVHGEHGDNGLRASVERAHKGVKECRGELTKLEREVGQFKETSMRRDIEMQEKVIKKIDAVEHGLVVKIDGYKTYQNMMLITILLAVIGSIIVPAFL